MSGRGPSAEENLYLSFFDINYGIQSSAISGPCILPRGLNQLVCCGNNMNMPDLLTQLDLHVNAHVN